MTKTSDSAAATTQTKFQQIVADATEAKKSFNSKLTENAIKRKFQSAFDSAEAQKDDAQLDYNRTISDLDRFDVNALVNAKATIIAAEDAQDLIKETYLDLFGEELN